MTAVISIIVAVGLVGFIFVLIEVLTEIPCRKTTKNTLINLELSEIYAKTAIDEAVRCEDLALHDLTACDED